MAAAHGPRPDDIHLIHRDLKPANILISRRERFAGMPGIPEVTAEGGVYKVADFDASILGRSLQSAATEAQIPVGTLPYMPPEQAVGRAVFASDVYALGVIAYQLLTGRLPIVVNTKGMDPHQMVTSWDQAHRYSIIHAIEDVRPKAAMNPIVETLQVPIHTALSKQVKDRQANMIEFYGDFAAAVRRGLDTYQRQRR
jgi:serine/threonine protein kinase